MYTSTVDEVIFGLSGDEGMIGSVGSDSLTSMTVINLLSCSNLCESICSLITHLCDYSLGPCSHLTEAVINRVHSFLLVSVSS